MSVSPISLNIQFGSFLPNYNLVDCVKSRELRLMVTLRTLMMSCALSSCVPA